MKRMHLLLLVLAGVAVYLYTRKSSASSGPLAGQPYSYVDESSFLNDVRAPLADR